MVTSSDDDIENGLKLWQLVKHHIQTASSLSYSHVLKIGFSLPDLFDHCSLGS